MRVGLNRAVFIIAMVGLLLLSACGSSNKPKAAATPLTPRTGTPSTAGVLATGTPVAAQASPSATPTSVSTPSATPTETPDDSPMARLLIPKIKVDAKFVTLGIIASTNTMDSPKNKDDIGYYDFTPRPGYGGNTVVSGHVDWYTGQTGVFWDLKKIVNGDQIQIALEDGKTYNYKVTDTHLYDAASAPVDDIIGDTPVESVTIITCEGVFDKSAAEYDKRRVIRAERVYS
ncbi:MAG: class F sortase [Dehalococcoidia bacterium]